MTPEQVKEKKLVLDTLGRKAAEVVNEIYPNIYGSIVFNFKNGKYCNWEINERGENQKN